MNLLLTQIRHGLTFLAGIGSMLLAASLITPAEVDQANSAGAQLIEPLMVLIGLIAACAVRLFMAMFAKTFENIGSKSSGTWNPVWTLGALITGTGLMGFSQSSCSAADVAAARAVPAKFCVITDAGEVCYSNDEGLSASVDARSGK